MNRAKLNDIMELISRLLEPEALECIEAEWDQHDRILRLYVDRSNAAAADGATVNLDDCVRASRRLNEAPELDEAVPGAYTLEVSSPGVERPLRLEQHFQRFVGSKVHVTLREKLEDRWRAEGILETVEDRNITLNTPEGSLRFPLDSLKKASLVYDWGN